MILRSFTKFFGIPGMRLGCLLGAPELVTQLSGEQEPWSVNTMAQTMGVACLAERRVHQPDPDPDQTGVGIPPGAERVVPPGLTLVFPSVVNYLRREPPGRG